MYIEREVTEGRYRYKHRCPQCGDERWTCHAKQTICKKCAGKNSYTPAKVERADLRKRGDGYITKQGYHLVYDGRRYVPAHRLAFPDIPDDYVVHHIDGDKTNNKLSNLYPCSKADHRKVHHQLEAICYELVRSGLITFEDGNYIKSTTIEESIVANLVNSGETLPDNAEGNPEPSPARGRCNDYPLPEYVASAMEARDTQIG